MPTAPSFDGSTTWTEDYNGSPGGNIAALNTYTDAQMDAFLAAHAALTAAHGATGAVVGTTNAQALTNKTIDGALNTLQNIPQASITGLVAAIAALPRGRLASAVITASQAGISAATDLTNLSVAPVFVTGRRYRISVSGSGMFSTVLNDVAQVMLLIGGNIVAVARNKATSITQAEQSFGFFEEVTCVASGAAAPSQVNAGAVTVKLQAQRVSGTGTITVVAAANNTTNLLVEDIGT